MKYTVVLPSIYPDWTNKCLASCKLENILVVDNTIENKGVAASWNLGIDKMNADGSEWLILMSASMRFGEAGGLDFIEQLKTTPFDMVECELGHGWHFIAFRKSLIDIVGRFDENFYPAYFEDLDYGYRVILNADKLKGKHKVYADVFNAGFSHGTMLGKVQVDAAKLKDYLERKWGKNYEYKTPFNQNLPNSYWKNESVFS